MKKPFSVRTIILSGSLVLQLSILCFHSRGAPGDVDLSFDPGSGVNGPVNAVVVQPDGKVIIGGEFTTVKGLVRSGLARLNADGSGDTAFNPGTIVNGVSCLALQSDGKVLVGNGGIFRLISDGSQDTNFNAGVNANVTAIALQPDGKLIVAGEGLLRLNADGTFDTNYLSEVVSDIYALALQPNGKLIVGGYLYDAVNNTSRYGLARFNANGSRDNSFDAGAAADGIYNSVVVQPDGKVLFGGVHTKVNGTNYTPVARLNADGTVDASFNLVSGTAAGGGAGGLLALANAISLQPDGKVILGGEFVTINGHARTNLARLNADGSLDLNFQNEVGGVSGQPQSYPGTSVKAIALRTNGTMLIGGAFTTVKGTNRNRLASLNANGSLDGSFDPGQGVGPGSLVAQPDGKVVVGNVRLNADGSLDNTYIQPTDNNTFPADPNLYLGGDYSITTCTAVQMDGKVLIGGFFVSSYVEPTDGGIIRWNQYFLMRFNVDASRDTNFDQAIGPADYGQLETLQALAVQPDGKLLVGGIFTSMKGTNRYGIARLNANGTLDNGFNAAAQSVSSILLQADGRIFIVGGYFYVNGTNRGGIARLNADGSLDNSFNPGTGANLKVSSFLIQPDGKVLIGGDFTTVNGVDRNRIARLNANGSLDNTFNPGTGANGAVSSIVLQPDGNVLISGDFLTVNGVVRPHVARLYGDSAPSLNIARSNESVIVSWPVIGLNFQLQETTDLSFPNSWSAVVQSAVTNANQISVTVPTTIGRKFFRLKSQ